MTTTDPLEQPIVLANGVRVEVTHAMQADAAGGFSILVHRHYDVSFVLMFGAEQAEQLAQAISTQLAAGIGARCWHDATAHNRSRQRGGPLSA